MKLYISGSGTNLILFFLGYGQDPGPFQSLQAYLPDDSALALVYDYENDKEDFSCLENFSKVRIIAWSMGVVFAPRTVQKLHLNLEHCYAINGTVEGIDDCFGIPLSAWNKTLEDLTDEKHALNFYRLMCRKPALIKQYLESRPKRDLKSLRNELEFIKAYCAGMLAVPASFYDQAFCSLQDVIMPPAAVKLSFKRAGVDIEELNSSHYDPEIFMRLITKPFLM